MDAVPMWSWAVNCLQGACSIVDGLAAEGSHITEDHYWEIEKCQARLQRTIARLAARPELNRPAQAQPEPEPEDSTSPSSTPDTRDS